MTARTAISGPTDAWAALVERDGEYEAIDRALTRAVLGHGPLVLLYGQAGVGRSALLRAAIRDAQQRGFAVLRAAGSDMERGYGFGVLRQLLEAHIAELTKAQRRSLLGYAGPSAEAALGLGPFDKRASSASFEQIEGVYRLVTAIAEIGPLLVAVDDLQWCDRPSLDFLCFLGHRVMRLPVTLIAAWRRGEPGVRAGRLQALAGEPETVFLSPSPLSRDGVRAVLRSEAGSDPDDEILGVVHARTGGLPFLVSELAAGLALRDVALSSGHREEIEAITPESVRRNVVARLGRHSETVRRLAHAVAVLGAASLSQAAELAAIEPGSARDAADALVRAGILCDEATLSYAQPLLRAAAYDTMTSLECAELHGRAAALLDHAAPGSEPGDLERVVEHLMLSEPVGNARFGELLRGVAARAAEEGDAERARRLLARALGEIAEPAARGDVLVRLAELELRAGDVAAAAARAEEALALAATPAAHVAATLASAQALAATAGCGAAVELLDTSTLRLVGSERDLELQLWAAAATLRICAGMPAWASPDAVLRLEGLAGETPAERSILAACAAHMTLTGDGSAARVTELCGRALGRSAAAADSDLSLASAYLACRALLEVDPGDAAQDAVERVFGPPRPGAADDRALCAAALRAQLAFARGDLAQADVQLRAVLQRIGELAATPLRGRVRRDVLAGLAGVALERGVDGEADRALAQLAAADEAPDAATVALRIALALAGSVPAAATDAAAAAEAQPVGIVAPGIAWRPWAALAHHAAGDDRRAVALAAAHLDHAREWGAAPALGRALVVRGIVDPGDERLTLMATGVAVLEPTAARLDLARATIELGVALRRARRRTDSRDQLVRGADLAHRCGAAVLGARAREELVALGARPRRAAYSGVSSLTAGELRVARLAAAGMTNRAIAHELTVSVKTVSGQLTAVYRKLDVHDRAALALAMQPADGRDRALGESDREAVG